MIKTLSKLGIEGNFLNLIKNTHKTYSLVSSIATIKGIEHGGGHVCIRYRLYEKSLYLSLNFSANIELL